MRRLAAADRRAGRDESLSARALLSVDAKADRRRALLETSIKDPAAGGLIDDFYTYFSITEDDRECLERFLHSSNVENRREALLALIWDTTFTGYALDALLLHVIGVAEKSDAMFTGVSALSLLRQRGDIQAATILDSLEKNDKWRRTFMEIHIRGADGNYHD